MSTTTENYGLIKPELTDTADITAMNGNWEKIDHKLKEIEESASALPDKLPVQNGGLYINSETTEEDKAEAHSALYDLGMASLSDHVIKTFGDVKEIGLTRGSETIEDIASKLPPFSMLQMTINSETNNTIYPNSGYGQLFVRKGVDATRTFFEHYNKDTGFWNYGWYKDSWSGWIECGNPAGYLPLDGSVSMSGKYLNFYNNYCLLKTDENSVELTTKNVADSNANMRTLSLLNGSYMENVANSLKLNNVVNGTHKYYNIFGEHNKPSGSYTGNSSSTTRTINIGGTGNVLFITSSYGFGFVTADGGFFIQATYDTTAYVISYSSSYIKFIDGVLTIASSSSYINNSSYEYTYRVL